MEKINVSELEEMIRSKFVEKGASEEEIKEEVVKSITEKIKNKSKEEVQSDESVDNQDVVDVDISKPKDVEGKIPAAITSSVETSDNSEEILSKELALKIKEEELTKREEDLNQRESSLKSIEKESEYEPELPEQIEEIEPEKLFIFDENNISVSGEKLSTLEMNLLRSPEEKTNMRAMWLKDAVKDVDLYVANFEKIGKIEFDPFEGTAEFKNIESEEVEEIDSEDIKLDMQGNMKDSIEPVSNVTQATINESVEINPKSEQLSEDIINSIFRIDDSMHYQDFAIAVARVLEDSYGSHNYLPFISELKRQLSND